MAVLNSKVTIVVRYCLCSSCSGGLVQRSTGTSSSEASGWGASGQDKDLDVPDVDDGYDDKGEDSKTVRLTLMEEVLLLGIKDREVCVWGEGGW